MKIQVIATIAGLIGCLVGVFIGVGQGGKQIARHHLRGELRIHLQAYQDANDNPQLKEYLKSRIYFLVCLLEDSDLEGCEFDFGSIDESTLGCLSGIKGPESQQEIYERAIEAYRRVNKKGL